MRVRRGDRANADRNSTDAGRSRDREGGITVYHSGGYDQLRISRIARYSGNFSPAQTLDSDGDTVALIPFDEGNGAVAADASGNGHEGTLSGIFEWRADDGFGQTFCD